MTLPDDITPAVRDLYYRAVFDAFLRYIAANQPFSMRTTVTDGSTDVTLRFRTEAFSEYMRHLEPPEGTHAE